MNMFDEISKEKIELPKINTITKQLTKYELNTYQNFIEISYKNNSKIKKFIYP